METSLVSIPASIVFVVALIALAWRVLEWLWLKPKRLERHLKKQGFRGNPYRFLWGAIKEDDRAVRQATSRPIDLGVDIAPRVIPFTLQTVTNYGKNSFFWFGPTPLVIITDPEHIREIFNRWHDFEKISGPLAQYVVTGLVALKGEKWAKHRKLLNPAFRAEKLKLMIPAFYQSCSDMINKWQALILEGSSELDVWPDLQALSSDAISRTAFGSNYEEGRRIFELSRELTFLAVKVGLFGYLPGSRLFPSKTRRMMKAIDKEVKDSIKAIISKRENSMKAGEPTNEDLLGILMQSNHEEIEEKGDSKEFVMSTEEIIDECKLFYFAGQETTSTLLVWTMILLSQHSDWQQHAREEVLQVFGTKDPHFDGLNHLKVVTMILYEALRLYPPVVGLTRRTHQDLTLGNFTLPAGVQVLLPIILVHHDRQLWGHDALEFKPERFSEGISKATNNQASFFPFGWGPRICIGQNFALVEAKIAIAMILQRFSFELSPSYTHAPYTVVTLQPQHGAHLILHKL